MLTGETGAGKSILLDALGLALGRRAEAGLVRAGAEGGGGIGRVRRRAKSSRRMQSCARPGSTAIGETIVLRRLLATDGRSRAFVNDAPSSVGLLRELGDSLVEIQGQFEQRGLLDPANHRMMLDAFAEHPVALAQAWHDWRVARGKHEAEAARLLAASREEEELLRHHLAELDALAPEEGEEERLAERRTLLQNAERLAETVAEAIGELGGNAGAQAALARAMRRLERARERAQGFLDAPLAAAERAGAETAEALAVLESAAAPARARPARARTGRGAALRAARSRRASISYRSPSCRHCNSG